MASKRFEIDMGLNASDVAKGAKDAQTALDNLEKAVGDVGDESKDSGGDVSDFARKIVSAAREAGKSDDDIKDALRSYGINAKEAERAVGRVGDEFQDTGRTGARSLDDLEDGLRDVQRQTDRAKDAVDDFDVRGRAGFGKVAEGAKEVTQEVGQNLGEAVSSIRGDLSDLGQVGQDTLGGLAATLAGTGPAGVVGAAALAGGAVGLGLVTAQIDEQNKRVQKLRDHFTEAWRAAVEGGRDYIDTATIVSQINDIALSDDYATERQHALEASKTTGIDLQTIYRALAGDAESLDQVHGRLTDSETEYWNTLKDVAAGTKTVTQEQADQYRDQHNAVSSLIGDLDGVTDANARAAEQAEISARAISDQLLSAVDSADSATKAVDDFGNVLITLPDGQEIVIDAKTGKATSDVSKFKTDTDAVIKHLDGRQIDLIVKTALRNAQNELNGFVSRNSGRTIRLHGRFDVSPIGGDI